MIKNEEIYMDNIAKLLDEFTEDCSDIKLVFGRFVRTLFKNNDNERLRIDTDYFGEMVANAIDRLVSVQGELAEIRLEIDKAREGGYSKVDGYKEKYNW